jgi:prepilin-type N-terminal cleavage/methylation domain-containing protein/prepilin-type processing-associated H-X9-DG protein
MRIIARSSTRAFTLMEMLVVISIITLLISMTLPALRNSKESGKSIRCATHLRQVHLAGLSYSDDNTGYLPVGAGLTPGSWSPTWDQLIKRYGATNEVIICPSHTRGSRHYWVNSNYINSFKNWGDQRQTGVMSLGFSVRLDRIQKPSDTVSWMELRDHDASFAAGGISEPGSGWASICWDAQDYLILWYPHLNQANFAHCDSHVETLNRERALGPKDASGNFSLYRFAREK